MSLPWMETLTAATGSAGAPLRFGCVFMGNGVNVKHWTASQTPDGLALGRSLSPLEPVKNQLLYFKGLYNPTTLKTGGGGHYPKMNVLSGLKVKQTTTDIEVGTSVDQLIAHRTGKDTAIPSLVIGTEGPRYSTELGYTSIYSNHISWAAPNRPAPKEIYPRLAFDRLFSDGRDNRRNRSILDAVWSDAKSLRGHLSNHDATKLDEYLNSVRELEQRIERSEQRSKNETNGHGWQPAFDKPTIDRPGTGLPSAGHEHMQLMLDIMVMAFQTDRTRVVSLMLNNDLSGMNFSHLGGIKGGLHEISHHQNQDGKLDMYQRINQYHIELWSQALQKMRQTNEGERTLLDNSMILFCSSLMDGNSHDSKQLPVLVAGGGGGTLKGNRAFDLSKDPNRKLCRLHLALLNRMGVETNQFGDAESALDLG